MMNLWALLFYQCCSLFPIERAPEAPHSDHSTSLEGVINGFVIIALDLFSSLNEFSDTHFQ